MPEPVQSHRWPSLLGFIGAALGAGAIGSWATFTSVTTWYPLLHKPAWNPPAWLFGPVWTVLYVLMGVAAWRVWRTRAPTARALLIGYFIQLVLNAGWSILFFGLKHPLWALADIAVLWAVLVGLQAGFMCVDRVAAWLWLPYLLWVGFAAALNSAIVRLN